MLTWLLLPPECQERSLGPQNQTPQLASTGIAAQPSCLHAGRRFERSSQEGLPVEGGSLSALSAESSP